MLKSDTEIGSVKAIPELTRKNSNYDFFRVVWWVSWMVLFFSTLLTASFPSSVNNYKQFLRTVNTDRQSQFDVGGA